MTKRKSSSTTRRKTSPRTDSKREGVAIARARKEISTASAAITRAKKNLGTARRYNKSERRGMKR